MKFRYLYKVNNQLLNHRNIYIGELSKRSKELFIRFALRRIKIEGFVSEDKEKVGIFVLGHPVKYVEDRCLYEKDSVVICFDEKQQKRFENSYVVDEIWQCDFGVLDNKINIWGAGKTGKRVLDKLAAVSQEMHVYDSDEKKCGMEISCGLKVENINCVMEEKSFILACMEIDNMIEYLEDKNVQEVILVHEVQGSKIYFEGEGNPAVTYNNYFFELIRDVQTKKVFVYDKVSEISNQYINFLKMLGLKNINLLDEQNESSIYDLIYEEDVFVVLSGDNIVYKMKKLEEIGLEFGKDYNLLNEYRTDCFLKRIITLDPNLGYATLDDRTYPGFCVFGSSEKSKIKIVTLGGSTTDANLYPFKSWSELLYEKLRDKGIETTIFCGGVNGYQVSQELIKLQRDVRLLKPDIVISYSGLNNLNVNARYPFLHSYQETIFEIMNSHLTPFEGINRGAKVTKGLDSEEDLFEFWLRMEQYMRLICEFHNISFLGILQPNMLNKKNLSKYETEIMENFGWCLDETSQINSNYFRNEMRKKNVLIHDFSSIFDDEENVYIDGGHVWEMGNRIIAEKIYEILIRDEKWEERIKRV